MTNTTTLKHFKKAGLALAVASAFCASSAMADVRATSVVELTNLTFTSGGNVLDYVNDFQNLSFTNSADYDVSLSGFGTLSEEVTGGTSSTDFPVGCLGDCGFIAENDFPVLTGAVAPGGNFAAADQVEFGSPISNQPDFPVGAGAFVANSSYVGLSENGTGSVNSNNGLTASWAFTAGFDGALEINFDLRMYTEAFVDLDERFPSFAQATATVEFIITNLTSGGTEVFSLITSNVSRNAPSAPSAQGCGDYLLVPGGPQAIPCGTALSGPVQILSFGNLIAGQRYNLAARINTNADAQKVPEPGILALFGAGLALIGLQRRRKLKLR